MFEKEAIDRANRKYPIPRVYDELDVARNRKYEEGFKDGAEFGYNKAMNEAKGIIKDLLHCLPKENIEGVYEVIEKAEQFLSEVEE